MACAGWRRCRVALGHCVLIVAGMEVWSKTAVRFPRHAGAGRSPARLTPPAVSRQWRRDGVLRALPGHVLWRLVRPQAIDASPTPRITSVARLFRLLPLVMATSASVSCSSPSAPPVRTSRQHGCSCDQHERRAVVAAGRDDRQHRDLHRVAVRDAMTRSSCSSRSASSPPRCRSFAAINLVVYLPAYSPRRADPPCPGTGVAKPRAADARRRSAGVPSIVFSYRGITRVLEILAAAAIVGCVAVQRPHARNAPIRFLGAVSYPFYLVHPLGMDRCTAFHRAAARRDEFPVSVPVFMRLVSLLISLPVAWLLHVTVEMPALKAPAP